MNVYLKRIQRSVHAIAVALDQLAQVVLSSPKFVRYGGPEPSAQETISSKVGRMANHGKRWALIAQVLIDRLFMLFGSPPGHCQRAIVAPIFRPTEIY